MPASARAGAIAPCEVTVPAQNTGLGPEKTSFFQALGITTKISRGTIEILVSEQKCEFLMRPYFQCTNLLACFKNVEKLRKKNEC